MANAQQTVDDLKGDLLSIHMFNVVGNGQVVSDGVMNSGSPILTSATANFENADIGKHVLVKGAGPTIAYPTAGSGVFIAQYLEGNIIGFTSPTSVTLSVNAQSNVTGSKVNWGTDYTTLIQASITVAGNKNAVIRGYQGIYHITAPILVTKPMTIRLDQCQFIAQTDSIFRVQASNVVIDGVHRNTTTLTQVKSTGNVIRVDCHHDFVTVKNCGLIAVPRWYDEANLFNGNAIYAGGSLADGTCSDETYSTGHVYEKNYISTGQNGIVLTHQNNARISDNLFTVTDRTGTQRVTGITFGDYKGLSHVTLVQCQYTKCVNNQSNDPVGIPNAFYDRIDNNHVQPPIADNEFTNNICTGNYRIEVINCGLPRAKVNDNKIYVGVPDTLSTGVRFGFGADDSKCEGNSIYMAANAGNLGNGVLLLGQDMTHILRGVAVNNNTITCPNGAILMADFTDSCSIKATQTTILANMGTPSSMIAISAQGTFCTNHSIQNNTDRGAALGVSLQGSGVTSITVRSNVSNSPSSVGVSVQDGAGANCIITGNTVNSAGIFGVNIVVTAVGPVILGHNYILNAGTSEYNRGVGVSIVPERFQDANIRQAGWNVDPTHLLDVRDDVLGSVSMKVAGNEFRDIQMRVASNVPGSNTASILDGVAEKGTIDTPGDVTGLNEILRASSSARFGGVDVPVVFVSGWSNVFGGNVGGQFHVQIKPYSGAIRDVLFIDQDGSAQFLGTILINGGTAGIYSGTGAPAFTPASVGSIYLQTDGTFGSFWVYEDDGGLGWKLAPAGLFHFTSGSAIRTDLDLGVHKDPGVAFDVVGEMRGDSSLTLLGTTATRPAKFDSAHKLKGDLINLSSGNDVDASTIGANNVAVSDGTKLIGVAGIASGVVTEVVSPSLQPCVTAVALGGVVPPGLILNVTYTPQPALTATSVNNHIVTDGVVTS